MDLIIFAGPSLGIPSPESARRIDFRPPAAKGDIARAVMRRPKALGLIDGVFATAASVWHKEIVYALAEGVDVFGAASMGALRAVELAPFGMIGIGEIFQAYRDGVTEDDDDVAVLHGPAELGFVTITEPMVNVSATLSAASNAGIVTNEEVDAIRKIAKSIYYMDRTWNEIIARAQAAQVPATGNCSPWVTVAVRLMRSGVW